MATPTDILRGPANDYVSAFFRGVDVSQVFTIGPLARRSGDMEIEGEETAARVALDKLRKSEHEVAAVVDAERRLIGTVTGRSLEAAIRENENARCRDAFVAEIRPVRQDTVLAKAMPPLAASTEALPVVDDDGRYVGLVSKSEMLRALERRNRDKSGSGTRAQNKENETAPTRG